MEKDKNKQPPIGMKIGESVFCAGYLIFAFCSAVILFTRIGGIDRIYDEYCFFAGIMIMFLAFGDSFHLIPRIIRNLRGSLNRSELYLGIGNLISSVTMTVFYVLMYFVVSFKNGLGASDLFDYVVLLSLDLLAVVRVCLCLVPANRWFDGVGSLKWGIMRNVPFVVMGILMVAWLIYRSVLYGWNMYLLAVLIVLSFAFYIPVVLFAKKKPAVGMLMIPKTICYIVMICLFL
ncbi:MAG: hypothetical protein K6F79_09150 [Saccharofermentans sp.]|nr:hypothetical protein [Saccharofermentans sp.]